MSFIGNDLFNTSIWFQFNIQLLIATTTDYVLRQFDSFILRLWSNVDWQLLFKSAPPNAIFYIFF